MKICSYLQFAVIPTFYLSYSIAICTLFSTTANSHSHRTSHNPFHISLRIETFTQNFVKQRKC